ncbi:hypothetical protein [Dethiobacter alkaliphilus]|uniref:Uncharacterized protein n=1 Tax=Dethiobacter alkaliphilus AHT 1 TaxID=555088 RepID=C0GD75_DETAL|nr:hypothetical protein [Dethiobacter alkaliphilus]EEG78596.1 hypothetical protein DealDRAFT_0526 [Dethiobacter alkaliphilus AHT 1]
MKFKRTTLFALFLGMILLFIYVQSPRVGLSEVSVDIITDEAYTGSFSVGNNQEIFVSTALIYEFTLANTGRRQLGKYPVTLQLTLEHESDLLNDILYSMGWGFSGPGEIPPNEESKAVIHYELGVIDTKGVGGVQQLPDQDVLDEILDKALEATLIISEGHNELTRIDLRKYKTD